MRRREIDELGGAHTDNRACRDRGATEEDVDMGGSGADAHSSEGGSTATRRAAGGWADAAEHGSISEGEAQRSGAGDEGDDGVRARRTVGGRRGAHDSARADSDGGCAPLDAGAARRAGEGDLPTDYR